MQEFYIKKGAILPTLRIELIEDGRHSYNKFFELIQNSSITFTMVNRETGVKKVEKVTVYIKYREDGGWVEQYKISYDLRKNETKE